MAREDLHFRLRIPDELKSRIEEAAAKARHSMTAEIVARLGESFEEGTRKEQLRQILHLSGQIRDLEDQLTAARAGAGNLPPGLLQRIQAQAEARGQSVQEEVIQALEAAFPPPALTFGDYMADLRLMLESDALGEDGTTRQLFEALLRSYEKFAARDPEWVKKRPHVPVRPNSFPMNLRPADDPPRVARPEDIVSGWHYLAPFIRARNEAVMDALANGDLDGAIKAAKQAESQRDVGT